MTTNPFVKLVEERGRACMALLWNKGLKGIASGVCIRSERGYYVATALHFLPHEHWKSLAISTLTRPLAGTDAPLKSLGRFLDERFDVAIVQLDPAFAKDLSLDWIELDEITTDTLAPTSPVFIMGFPQHAVRLHEVTATAVPYFISTRMTERRFEQIAERVRVEERPDRRVDIVMDGPDRTRAHIDEWGSFNPHGMSGGPIFGVAPFGDADLFSRKHVLLCGLQTGVYESLGLIRGIRADYIPQLIAKSEGRST